MTEMQGLVIDALKKALALQDRMLSEILRLHRDSNEMLPLDLISAKEEFDKAMHELLAMQKLLQE